MMIRTLLIAALTILSANPANAEDLPGLNYSTADPVGEPWVLPEGIELVATIESFNPFDADSCKNPNDPPRDTPPTPLGIPVGQVRVCMQFINHTNRPIKIPIVYGLQLISESDETQNGLIVQTMELEVLMDQPLFAPIRADCMNTPRGIPGLDDRYRIGPVIQHPPIVEALRLLADRDLSDPVDAAFATAVLKPLYLGKPLTDEGRNAIADLPARTPG